jgi:hypothetical protein
MAAVITPIIGACVSFYKQYSERLTAEVTPWSLFSVCNRGTADARVLVEALQHLI